MTGADPSDPTIVKVQAILYATLAISLSSALLAMLGKQWLSLYASAGMRGSIIERCHNRQRKLNGMVNWRFENVMEVPPLMLQFALLLLGCAMSLYLSETQYAAISLTVLCLTSICFILYLLIVVAGVGSESCPYQTPASRAIRSLASAVTPTFRRNTELFRKVRTIRGSQEQAP